MKIAIYYSSRTGNTRKLAEYLRELLGKTHEVLCFQTAPGQEPVEAEVYLLGFWCRKSGLDDLSLKLLEGMTGKKLLAFGTMGGGSDPSYEDRVLENVRRALSERNTCLGACVCLGAVELERVEKRRQLPPEHPHYVSPEKYERFLELQDRPNEEDLKRIGEYVMECLE